MGIRFDALSKPEQLAVADDVRRQYESTASLQPETYVSQNARAHPKRWQDGLRELVASDPKRVQIITEAARRESHADVRGFTLIELSIVLVVIGLIVGGVLVGQDLIRAAGVRATISQIEKYNTAANTFREKYGYLPGDIPAGPAAQFGFLARGTGPGQGDGNGLIEGGGGTNYGGLGGGSGEQLVFWVDLSTAHLIKGGFTTANFLSSPGYTVNIAPYLPQAQLGGGNYIFVTSGGWGDTSGTNSNGTNYFSISAVSGFITAGSCSSCVAGTPGLTVAQAAAIDAKLDDGMPLSGNVLAALIGNNEWIWPPADAQQPPPTTYTIAPSVATCFDNGGNNSNTMHYSVGVSNGANVACGLTFKMQAGD